MRPAALAVALAGSLPAPALAQDYSWTPCHRLEMGGKLHELCRACEGQGSGWRFYVSRSGAQTQCQRDSQANSGIYRKPWEDDAKPERRRETRQARPAYVPAPAAPQPERRSSASSNSSPAKPASSVVDAPLPATGTRSTRAASETREPRSPASHAAVPARRTSEYEHAAPPKPRPRTEAENRRASENRREQGKSEP
jgi:hypothetical protein